MCTWLGTLLATICSNLVVLVVPYALRIDVIFLMPMDRPDDGLTASKKKKIINLHSNFTFRRLIHYDLKKNTKARKTWWDKLPLQMLHCYPYPINRTPHPCSPALIHVASFSYFLDANRPPDLKNGNFFGELNKHLHLFCFNVSIIYHLSEMHN